MSGIYIHIPYCTQACHYCDFHFSTNLRTQNELINCLAKEIGLQKNYLPHKNLDTIYFGGGTPSILTREQLTNIFDTLDRHFKYDQKTEITLEANPEDLSFKKINSLKSVGINRLSIGVQSFENKFLTYFNRSHNATQAIDAIKNSQKNGIKNISIDLIYGIPDQTLKEFETDLEKAIDLGTTHISAYCLTIEEKTVFGKWHEQKKLNPIDEGLAAEQFELLIERLTSSGYEHYEISNFAKAGFQSRHNSNYWCQNPYLGIGPGAHSFDGDERQFNISNNPLYIKSLSNGQIPKTVETLTQEQKINEFILTRIRTSSGIDLLEIKEKFGTDLMNLKANEISVLMNQNMLTKKSNCLKLSIEGRLFADKITEDLIF